VTLPPRWCRREISMQIEKSQIVDILKSRGDSDQASRALGELPDTVDTDKDKGLLDKYGIDLGDIATKVPGSGGPE